MTGTPRRRAPRGAGEHLRTQIIDAAKQLLTETGSATAVSIRAVADLVGVTPPSIYLHFADKDTLLAAVVADVFQELDERMSAVAKDEHPLERLRQQGLAYVRFALEAPEPYRLATMISGEFNDIDSVLTTSAFAHLAETVTDCMTAGIYHHGDPTPLVLDLWSAAHGIASLLITKPHLPWGDPMDTADRVLGAAAAGRSVLEHLNEPTPRAFTTWLQERPPHAGE